MILTGSNVDLAENSSWHIAILLAPGWGKRSCGRAVREPPYITIIIQLLFRAIDLMCMLILRETPIIAEIDRSLLFDVDNISRWMFTVALTSYDWIWSL